MMVIRPVESGDLPGLLKLAAETGGGLTSLPVDEATLAARIARSQQTWRGELNKENPVLIMGDMNISPTDLDIGIGEENRKRWLRTGKCSFLPEEREWMDRLLGWGLVDTWRQANPDNHEHFSWFDYRSKGFDDNRGLRIDLLLASQPLAQRCVETGIDYEIRGMEKPSDHAPVWATFRP